MKNRIVCISVAVRNRKVRQINFDVILKDVSHYEERWMNNGLAVQPGQFAVLPGHSVNVTAPEFRAVRPISDTYVGHPASYRFARVNKYFIQQL